MALSVTATVKAVLSPLPHPKSSSYAYNVARLWISQASTTITAKCANLVRNANTRNNVT